MITFFLEVGVVLIEFGLLTFLDDDLLFCLLLGENGVSGVSGVIGD